MLALAVVAPVALAQTGEPANDVQGFVTDISGIVVLVEENPADEWGTAKGAFTVTEETEILKQQGDELLPARFDDLRIGQRAAATYVGPVAESYPSQGTASSIIVLDEPPENEPGDEYELLCLMPEGCGPEGFRHPGPLFVPSGPLNL
jgi:hypothetical protein